jgi:hypothetical protein
MLEQLLEQLLVALKVIAVAVIAFATTLMFILLLEVVSEGGDDD